MHRWHITVPDELAGRVEKHLDGRPLSAFVRRAVEQALGSPGSPDAVAGVRGRVPAPVPAEQPPVVRAAGDAIQSQGPAGTPGIPPASFSRVRSSSAARPFRPAPKKGEK